jgi:hypothetical protein
MAETATVPVAGTSYRHVPAGAAPMPGRPAPDGRWQRGEQVAGLYLAQDRDTVWAEWYRALAELGEPPDSRLPRDLWRFRVALEQVADVSAPAALRALGLPDMLPDRSQWPRFEGRRGRARPGRVSGGAVSLERASHRSVHVRVGDRGGLHRHNAGRASQASSGRARAAARYADLNAARAANAALQSRT